MSEPYQLRIQALEDENRRLRAALAAAGADPDAAAMTPAQDGFAPGTATPTPVECGPSATPLGDYDATLQARSRARGRDLVLSRSDEWVQLAQEAVGIGGFSLDLSSNVLTVSHHFCEIFGLPQREHWTPEDIECLAMDDPFHRPSHREERNAGVMTLETEYPIVRPADSRLRWIARRARYVYDDMGQRIGLLGTVQDVTDRKRGELRQEAVLRLGDQLRALDSASSVYALGTEIMGTTLELVRAVYLQVDTRAGQVKCLNEWRLTDQIRTMSEPFPLSAFGSLLDELQRGATVVLHDVRADVRTSGGAQEWADFGIRSALLLPILDQGELVAVVLLHSGYLREWTVSDSAFARHAVDRVYAAIKRLESEATLQETELRLRLSLEAAAIGVWDYRPADDSLFADERLRNLARLPAGEAPLTIEALVQAFDPYEHDALRDVLIAAVHGEHGGQVSFEAKLRGHPLYARWAQLTGNRLVTDDGSVRLTGVMRDITSDVRAAESLREKADLALSQRQILVDILQCTPDLIAAVGPDFRLLTFNPAFRAEYEARLNERPRVGDDLQENMLRLMPAQAPTMLSLWRRALAGEALSLTQTVSSPTGGEPLTFETRYTPLFDATGAKVGAVHWSRDVTERTQTEKRLIEAEAALRQAQKMEAIGLLTSGIAHDFNNLLHGMVTALSLIKRHVAKNGGGPLERYADMATGAAHRAAALTHRLLAFSRQQPLDPKPVDTNALVASMEELFQRTFGSGIELFVSLAPDLHLTRCDANQLENALLNLVVNARDAMPAGGVLRISTRNATLDAATARGDVAPGDYVCLTVADEGVGMTDDVLAHAFDPFFTTKPRGQGTGLGLSMIYGFIKQSGGHIDVDTTPGQGTTFHIYLPRFRGDANAPKEEVPLPAPQIAGNGYVVQVVEDDDVIRSLTVEALEAAGYRVLVAADGLAGLASLRSAPRVDMLITDVGLPGLNGRQLADAARDELAELPVLFMTGYAESSVITPDMLDPGMEMIVKPFAMDRLLQRVGAMITATTARP